MEVHIIAWEGGIKDGREVCHYIMMPDERSGFLRAVDKRLQDILENEPLADTVIAFLVLERVDRRVR